MLVLVRGLPGSGKSTYARNLKDFELYEADMFHIHRNVYKFESHNITNSHVWCLGMTMAALAKGKNVVISNTFTRLKELKPYIDIALQLDVGYEVVTMRGEYGSIHGVPESTMEAMRNRWEEYYDNI